MKKLVLIVITVFLMTGVNAQVYWSSIQDPCLWASTTCLTVTSNGNLIAGGSCSPTYSTNNYNWNFAEGADGNFKKIVVSSNNDIFALANNNRNFFKSIDNGQSWLYIENNDFFEQSPNDFVINDNGDIYALSLGVLYKSVDGTISWDSISTLPFNAYHLAISANNILYASHQNNLFKSINNGSTWTSQDIPTTSNIKSIKVNINNDVFLGTNDGLFKSNDECTSWLDITPSNIEEAMVIDIIFNIVGDIIVSFSYESVYFSTNNGNLWEEIYGFNNIIATAIAIKPNNLLIAGTNDQDTWKVLLPYGETIEIPDANFLTALVNHNPTIDLNADGLIQASEATAYVGIISVPSLNIEDLSGIEAFINVTGIDCSQNQITELDLSNNVELESILCNNNQLISLNIANGNNIRAKSLNTITIANENFRSENNPDLHCIQVDNPNWSTSNWTNIDPQTFFNTDCSTSLSEIQISTFKLYPNPTKGQIQIEGKDIEKVEIYNLSGILIQTKRNNEIDLSKESKGVYFVKVTAANVVEIQKLILE